MEATRTGPCAGGSSGRRRASRSKRARPPTHTGAARTKTEGGPTIAGPPSPPCGRARGGRASTQRGARILTGVSQSYTTVTRSFLPVSPVTTRTGLPWVWQIEMTASLLLRTPMNSPLCT